MVRRLLAAAAVLVFTFNINVFAGELYSTDIRQVYCFEDIMRVYVDLQDKDSKPIDQPKPSQIEGSIDDTTLTTRSVNRFGDTNEGVADVFLVDISGSITDSQMEQVKAAIRTWMSNMKENDKMAIISFGDTINVINDFTNDTDALSSGIDSITNKDRTTQLYGGIMQALKLTERSDRDLPKRRNIILITDGINEYSGGVGENDVMEKLKTSLVPVYSMHMTGSGARNQQGLSFLNTAAEYSGGFTYDMQGKDINTVYDWIHEAIQNSYAVDFAYDGVSPDNNQHTLKLRAAQDGKIADDTVQFTLKKSDDASGTYSLTSSGMASDSAEKSEDSGANKLVIIFFAAAGALILAALGLILMLASRGRRQKELTNDIISRTGQDYGLAQAQNDTERDMSAYSAGIRVSFQSMETGKSDSFIIRDTLTVGRAEDNKLVLMNPTASAYHAIITNENGQLYIEDIGSTNGTAVNGTLIVGRRNINNGDMLMFGEDEYYMSLND